MQRQRTEKTHVTTIVKKLILGSNFPKVALLSTKNTVGIGLIKPKTAVATLSCKLYIGTIREKTKIGTIIRAQKETVVIDQGSD